MSEIITPDLCIIGAGAGGLALATGAAALGAKVVLVESGRLGGQRLHSGCIPTRALIAAARAAQQTQHSQPLGVSVAGRGVDAHLVRGFIAGAMAPRAAYDSRARLTGLGIRVIEAAGRFINKDTCAAADCLVKARRFVVATGSLPVIPVIPGLEMIRYLTTDSFFVDAILPGKLLILGAGPSAVEIGQACLRLGSEVTLIEKQQALGDVDPELRGPALAACRREGMVIRESSTLTRLEPHGAGLLAHVEGPEGTSVVEASHLLLAVGRQPHVHSLGLDAAGVPIKNGRIEVDAHLCTANKLIYAAGDVVGRGCFTHLAAYHAESLLRHVVAGRRPRPSVAPLPRVVATDPEIAEIGLSEAQARAAHRQIAVYRWPMAENDRARTAGNTSGLIKIMTRRNGVILGVGIVGEGAGEMLALWSLALQRHLKLSDLAGLQLPYPSRSDIAREAALQVPGTRPRISGMMRLKMLLRGAR
ncbi:MAG: FAD-dependent oxidoreductase [Hyphomicrobiales bacterium]|nr:FAD-dependent oxidoreductase [Hyphomicrobiales bacterium]